MSTLARAFTMRTSKRNHFDLSNVDHPDMPNMSRGNTKLSRNQSARVFDRSMISSPVLLSTTNVQTLNAMSISSAQKQQHQALRKVSSISSTSSRTSDKDSDGSSTGNRSRGTSVTERSSVGGSNPNSPKPNDSPNDTFFSHSESLRKSQLLDDHSITLSRERSGSNASRLSQERISPSGPKKAKSSVDLKARISAASFDPSEPLPAIPAVPARNPSHSKFAHEQLARKKSMQSLGTSAPPPVQRKWSSPPRSVPEGEVMSLSTNSRPSSISTNASKPPSTASLRMSGSSSLLQNTPKRTLTLPSALPQSSSNQPMAREYRASPDIFNGDFDATRNPFGPEIQQLDRIAEELVGTVRDAAREDDAKVMSSRNLHMFCAADYVADLTPLWDDMFVPGHEGGAYMEVQTGNRLVGWF